MAGICITNELIKNVCITYLKTDKELVEIECELYGDNTKTNGGSIAKLFLRGIRCNLIGNRMIEQLREKRVASENRMDNILGIDEQFDNAIHLRDERIVLKEKIKRYEPFLKNDKSGKLKEEILTMKKRIIEIERLF